MLMVSYCGQSMSIVRRPSCGINNCFKSSSREGEWTFFCKWLRIPIERTFFWAQKGSHVHKQLATLYVETTSLYTNNRQFCMYVKMTSSQSSGVRRRFLRPEHRGPQVSIVRASAPGDGPLPSAAQGL